MNNVVLWIWCLIVVGLGGVSFFIVWNFCDSLTNKAIISKLKKKVYTHPFIGKPDRDDTYLYEEGGYRIRYKIVSATTIGPKSTEWISVKYVLGPSKRAIKRAKKIFINFWYNRYWIYLVNSSLIILLLLGAAIFYFGLAETQRSKIDRFRWVVSHMIGIEPTQIQYIGSNWFNILSGRKTAVDHQHEPVTYTVSPLRWLWFGDVGYVTRWRGRPYGYDVNQLLFDKARNTWLKKEGQWQRNRITENAVEWEEPQGTGIREGKITGHEISVEDKKIHFTDK